MMATRSRGVFFSMYAIFLFVVLYMYYKSRPEYIGDGLLFAINLASASFFYLGSHMLRMLRLFVLTLEEKVNFFEIFRLYFYILFVSFPFPFKLGEIVKILELNFFFHSRAKGLLIVVLERFSDAIILLILLFALFIYNFGLFYDLKNLFLLLLSVVSLMIFIYLLLKSTIHYLEAYGLEKIHSKKSLKLLDACVYQKKLLDYIRLFLKGRFTFVLFLTILIWILEIISFYFLMKQVFGIDTVMYNSLVYLLEYIQGSSVELEAFSQISTLSDIVVYYSIFVVSGFIFLSYLPKRFNNLNKYISVFQRSKNKYRLRNKYIRLEK